MASSIINSDDGVVSGTSGIKTTGGDDGVLNIQNNGTTAVTVNASGNVGIGTTTPFTALDINKNLSVGVRNTTNFPIAGAENYVGCSPSDLTRNNFTININGDFAQSSRIRFYKSRGTSASPTTTLSGDATGDIQTYAYDGAAYRQATGISSGVTANSTSGSVSGALAFATNGGLTAVTERMRITSSGNVLIGTTTAPSSADVKQVISSANGAFTQYSVAGGTGGVVGSGATSTLNFYTYIGNVGSETYTERARITAGGYFKASNTGSYFDATGPYYELISNAATNILIMRNSNVSPYGPYLQFNAATPNNTTNYFLSCVDSTNEKCIIFSSGTVTNRTGTYNAFSDIKLKQDIVDANSQWDDIKALRVVKYRLKDEVAADPNYPAYIGLVAQEVEQVSAGLVEDCADFENAEVPVLDDEGNPVLDEEGNPQVTTVRQATGTVTKSVKYSILYMKAVKALQEAMERIETLEAKNDALEARIAALEESQP